MKGFLRKVAVLLTLTLLLTEICVMEKAVAAPAPGLSYPSKVLYIDGDALGLYTKDNCVVPVTNATGYTKTYAVTSGKDLINVSKTGRVTLTNKGVGTAVVTVTFSKKNEKDIKASFNVFVRRNATHVRLTNASASRLDQPLYVGDTITLQAAKSYTGSYAKGYYGFDNYRAVVTDNLVIESLTPEILTVKGFAITAVSTGVARIIVKAYQFSQNKFTGVQSKIYTIAVTEAVPSVTPTPTITPTPTPAPISAKQITTKEIELKTDKAQTSAPSINSISLVKSTNESKIDIASVTLDETDKTKVIINTYLELKDGLDYKVTFDGKECTFKATDGKVVDFALTPTQIEAGIPTTIYVKPLDAKGVVLGQYTLDTASANNISFSIESNYGYQTGDQYVLFDRGNTATAKVEYLTYNWDNSGNMINPVKKQFTISATDQKPVIAKDKKYTIAKTAPNYSSMTVNSSLSVMDTDYNIYLYMEDSQGNDISWQYTLGSSDIDTLLVAETISDAKGVHASIMAVSNRRQKAVVTISKDGKVVDTIDVTILAEKTLSSIDINKTSLTLSNAINEDSVVTVTCRDQYGTKIENQLPVVTCLAAPTSTLKTYVEENLVTYAYAELGKVTFNAIGLQAGTYTFRITVGNYSRTVTVTVNAPNTNLTSTYKLVLSDTSIDQVVPTSGAESKSITIRVGEYKNNVLSSYMPVSSVSLTVKHSDGTVLSTTNDGSNTWTVKVLDISTIPVSKIKTGSYTVTATISGKTVPVMAFTVTDSQGGVTFGQKLTKVNAGTWLDVLSSAFDFVYQGTNVNAYIDSVTYIGVGTSSVKGDNISSSTYVSPGFYNITSVRINVLMENNVYVPITVSGIGRTIEVK